MSRTYPGGRHARGLRIATHNVRGLALNKIGHLVHTWLAVLRLDVVLIQETHLSHAHSFSGAVARLEHASTVAARDVAHAPPLRFFWAHSLTAAHGVAVGVRADHLASGRIRLLGEPHAAADGRLIHQTIQWSGHTLTLASAYLPSGDAAGQRTFIASRLHPLAATSRGRLVLGGDFNFTPDPETLDRKLLGVGPAPDRSTERTTAAAMAALCAARDLRDVYRARHPGRRSFTFFHAGCGTAARLDRFYVPTTLLSHTLQCRTEGPTATSDHRPVVLHLAPASPTQVGPGQRRVRTNFLRDEHLSSGFAAWMLAEEAAAPTDHAPLLSWWPGFKRRLTREATRLNRMVASGPMISRASQITAADALRQAFDKAAAAASPVAAAVALGTVLDAARAQADALRATTLSAEQRARFEWLRDGERASPLLTQLMRPSRASRHVAALRSAGGGLTTSGPALADTMARAFASVSAAPPPDPAALAQVLAAVQQHGPVIDPALAATAGDLTIHAGEVRDALKRARPGAAPGPDGIPTELWRRSGDAVPRLLSRLYSAVGATGQVPRGFLDGDVAPIFKKGDKTAPANYRPITLLSTDYRLMTKVLATRMAPVLATVIGPHQTAFLPGRRITDNVMFTHLLPHLLASNQRRGEGVTGAVLAFLDFRKAYDTVSRDFLYAAMHAMGAGVGLIRWARTILSGTVATATVNGYTSAARPYGAGVRQGCPAAPVLYLFVAEALQRWLHTCPVVGVAVAPDVRVRCMQYADDTVPLLTGLSRAVVGTFTDAMLVFKLASGQGLNLSKVTLLPIGDAVPPPGTPLPDTVGEFTVVREAVSLGATCTAEGEPQPEWTTLLDEVGKSFDRVARLPLSAFGRAAAASSYGLGRMLHRASLHAVPAEVHTKLRRWTARLVDRGEGPNPVASRRRIRMPGVRTDLLPGRPARGGFGAMPWEQHLSARHAASLRRLVVHLIGDPEALFPTSPATSATVSSTSTAALAGPGTSPLIAAVDAIVRRAAPGRHPGLVLLLSTLAPDDTTAGMLPAPLAPSTAGHYGASLPPPLARAVAGLQVLGLPHVTHPPAAADGSVDWGAAAPLWANPLLQLEFRADQRTVAWPAGSGGHTSVPGMTADTPPPDIRRELWVCGFAHMSLVPGLHTVADLFVLQRAMNTVDRMMRAMLNAGPPAHPPTYSTAHTTLQYYCHGAARDLPAPYMSRARSLEHALRLVMYGMQQGPLLPEGVLDVFQAWHPGDAANDRLQATVTAMLAAIPRAWVHDSKRHLPPILATQPSIPVALPQAATRAAERAAADAVGWRSVPPAAPQPLQPWAVLPFIGPGGLTVRAATSMQLRCFDAERRQLHRAFAASALLLSGYGPLAQLPTAVNASCTALLGRMRALARLSWDNKRKEVFWRLAVNGVSAAGGHDVVLSGLCPCGRAPDPPAGLSASPGLLGRSHCFWHCRVADAVVTAVRVGLAAGGCDAGALECAHLWLLEPPAATVHPCAWSVVAVAAICAMEYGRRRMWAMHLGATDTPAAGQTLITDFLHTLTAGPAPADHAERASRTAVATFWKYLQDFVSDGAVPPTWATDTKLALPSHPFLWVDTSGSQPCLRLRTPA